MNLNNTEHCLWGSCAERSLSTAVYGLFYFCVAAVVLLTVCGNLLIIISVCHFKQLHTPTNMLILSLAVSDFMVGVFVIPAALIWMIESCWLFSTLYRICFTFMSYFLTTTSIFNVALISVDRYFALSKPFLYNKTVSLSTVCTLVLSVWMLLFLYNIMLQYYNGSFEGLALCLGNNFFIWSLVDLVLTFVLPLSIIIIFYVQVFFIVRKHATAIRELNSHTRTSNNMSNSMKSERKAAKVLGILVSVFLACLFPYFVYTVLGSVIDIQEKPLQKVLLLVYLNSAINPVIYALFYPWFRRSVKLILTLHIFCTDSSLISIL